MDYFKIWGENIPSIMGDIFSPNFNFNIFDLWFKLGPLGGKS